MSNNSNNTATCSREIQNKLFNLTAQLNQLSVFLIEQDDPSFVEPYAIGLLIKSITNQIDEEILF